jgi:hypothetical protein
MSLRKSGKKMMTGNGHECSETSGGSPVLVLIPVFNDWAALSRLLVRLDEVLADNGIRARALLVDDASTVPICGELRRLSPVAISSIDVLRLRRNLGHQRAIAIGLAYVEKNVACDTVVVMDGDGEDDPQDIPRLLHGSKQEGDRCIVFAERSKRSEGLVFRFFYVGYRILHRLLTGMSVRVGNFSVVPNPQLRRLVAVSELWNHYAAAVFKSRIPYKTVPTTRLPRLEGKPRMSFVALIVHGLSALAVHGEVVGVRLLIATGLAILAIVSALAAIIALRLTTDLGVPGWASTVGGVSLVLLTQGIMLTTIFVFFTLSSRVNVGFIPTRDYQFFVSGKEGLFPPDDS